MNDIARILLVAVLVLAYALTRHRRQHLTVLATLCAFTVSDAIRSLVEVSLASEAALYLAWPASVAFLAAMVSRASFRWFLSVGVAHAAMTALCVSLRDDPEARRIVYGVAHALAAGSFVPIAGRMILKRRAPTETESAALYLAAGELAWIVPVVFVPAEYWAWSSGLQSTILYLLLAGAHARWIWRIRSSSRSARSGRAWAPSPVFSRSPASGRSNRA